MNSRAMIVVGGGAGSRFGSDKLMTQLAGEPLVVHTVRAVKSTVDECVLVCRAGQESDLAALRMDVDLVVGGETRTASEIAGLAAVPEIHALIGIHDAARPHIGPELIDRLFDEAARCGGAIPVVPPEGLFVDKTTMSTISRAMAAQTPQVFRAALLRDAYRLADEEGFEGHDTAEVVARYMDTEIMAVPGDRKNIKVTYPEDLERVEAFIAESAHSEPR